jgi:TolB protein
MRQQIDDVRCVGRFASLAFWVTPLSLWAPAAPAAPGDAGSQLALGPVKQLTAVVNSYPSPSPDGERIVFQSNRTGRFELYVMARDGTGLQQLTNSPGNNVTPKWSPDGKLIVFAAEPQADNSEIYVMNADGSGVRPLSPAWGDDSHPSFSFDGKRVIFNSSRNTPDRSAEWSKQWHDVYSVKLDGSDLTRHTHCQTVCTYPSFSPDGKWIAYRKVVDTPGFQWDLTSSPRNSEVFVARVDGSDERNLSNNAAFDGWPVFTPDGRGVVFSSNRAGPARVGQLCFVALAGSAAPSVLTNGARSIAQPAISRDGKWLYAYANDEFADWEYGDVVIWPLGLP